MSGGNHQIWFWHQGALWYGIPCFLLLVESVVLDWAVQLLFTGTRPSIDMPSELERCRVLFLSDKALSNVLVAALVLAFTFSATAQVALNTPAAPPPTSKNLGCAEVLVGPPFAGLYGDELMKLVTNQLGEHLIGRVCPKEVIVEFFEAGGWKHTTGETLVPYNSQTPIGQADYYMGFCLQRTILLRWLERCRARASVYSLDGTILDIRAHFRSVFRE